MECEYKRENMSGAKLPYNLNSNEINHGVLQQYKKLCSLNIQKTEQC
jgi:hypothetical protein